MIKTSYNLNLSNYYILQYDEISKINSIVNYLHIYLVYFSIKVVSFQFYKN
ncbi:hypothetical protein RhiirC2_803302 [Rhizophagus irregularis]|uniref:Uncharacterized protein n=1 Tax=Rhizophagus irregularis TaxID=588596 RepID=A0A2N1LPP2_9GLOM|nr:hypothetical protein RhiirC2_803302 [Rhizophagus irregularis]